MSIYFLQEKKGISHVRPSTDSLYVDWDISLGSGTAEQYPRAFLNQNNRAHAEVWLFYYLFKNNFIKKRFLCDSLSTVLLVSLKLISIQQNWAWLHSKQILNAGWRHGSNCFRERAMQSWCVYCEARIFWEVCHLKLTQSMSCVISLPSARWTRKISCIVADKDYNVISSNLQENKALKDMWQKMWENEKQMFICLECRMDATGRKALGNVILPCGSQLLWHIEINKKSSVKIFLMANYIFSDWMSLRITLLYWLK